MFPHEFERDFNEDVKINRFKLDICCEEQAEIYNYWATQSAEAKKTKSELENLLSFLEKKLDLDCRAGRKDMEGIKATEGAIKSFVGMDEKIVELKQEIIEATKNLNILEGAVRAFDHRKSALENLRHLQISGYYADPTGRNKSSERSDDITKNLKRKND